jgi:hypothetical protein
MPIECGSMQIRIKAFLLPSFGILNINISTFSPLDSVGEDYMRLSSKRNYINSG